MAAMPDRELDLTTLKVKSGLTTRLMLDGGWAVLSILGLVFTTVGVATFFLASFMIGQEKRYEKEGRTVQGTVIKKGSYTSSSSQRGTTRRSTHYCVDYTFTTEDGQERAGEGDIPHSLWRTLDQGSAIEVQYLPHRPSENRPLASSEGYVVWLFALFPLIFGGSGLVMLFFAVRRARKYASLLANGRLTKAAVDRKEVRRNMKINGRHPYDVHYTFVLTDGTTLTGTDLVLDEDASRLEPGTLIGIIYQPADPGKCVIFQDKWRKFFQGS